MCIFKALKKGFQIEIEDMHFVLEHMKTVCNTAQVYHKLYQIHEVGGETKHTLTG